MVLAWGYGIHSSSMNLKNSVVFIFLSLSVSAEVFIPDNKDYFSVEDEYLAVHKEFVQQMCPAGLETQYKQLDFGYRGDGNYLPVQLNEKIDLNAIKKNILYFSQKEDWIRKQIEGLKQVKDFKSELKKISKTRESLKKLMHFKKQHFFSSDKKARENWEEKSSQEFKVLKNNLNNLVQATPFLSNFIFPLDHLQLRKSYEEHKTDSYREGRAKANEIYFYRKIVEDGASDEDLSNNDTYFRSVLSTVTIALEKKHEILEEDLRSDMSYLLNAYEKHLKWSKDRWIKRMEKWLSKTKSSQDFYQKMLNEKEEDLERIITEKELALYGLKDFVLNKEKDVYQFWKNKSELMQAMYVFETILYSEVGLMDGHDGLERRDIARVVFNRYFQSEYNSLSEADAIFKYLAPKSKKPIKENRWLNILFKEGEFSFTYFYIPGNFHIYCPDMTKTGLYLRKDNLKIAYEILKNQVQNFKAVRYYSRTSMLGRISMDSIWDDFVVIPERVGPELKHKKKVIESFLNGKYQFYYSFKDDNENEFIVGEVKSKLYAFPMLPPVKAFAYRNPHQFKFLASKKNSKSR